MHFLIRPHRGLSIIVLLLAAAAPGSAAQSGNAARVLELLSDERGDDAQRATRARDALLSLGSSAVPTIWELFSGRGTESTQGPVLDHDSRALLLESMGAWPRGEVLESLRQLAQDGGATERLRAIDWLGELAHADAMPIFLEQIAALDPVQLAHAGLAEEIEQSLTQLLRADRRIIRDLSRNLDELEPALLPILSRSLADTPGDDAFHLFGRLFGRSIALDRAALESLADWPRWRAEAVDGRCYELAWRRIHADDTDVRRLAAAALGSLGHREAVPGLLGLLEDEDPRVRRVAEGSLQRISGLSWSGTRERWESWNSAELAWWQERVDVITELEYGRNTQMGRALLSEFALHPSFRRDLSRAIAPLLASDDVGLAAAAAATLAHLAAPEAYSTLIAAVDDDREEVSTSAARALSNLTSITGPTTGAEWLARLDG